MSLFLLSFVHQFSYLGIFLVLAGGAIIVPLPEEVILLTAGYLVAVGLITAPLGILSSIVGLLAGDSFLFFLPRLGGEYAQKLRARVNKIGLEKTWLFAPSQPLRPVFILRFLTGIRFIAPIYAGFEQASWKGFLTTDFLSVVIFVPGMFWLGYEFHTSFIVFLASFELIRHSVFIGVLALAGVGVLPEWYRSISKYARRSYK
jgi:membrane protein DedA with SNARE-associated domain